jgi:type I restriction enzyme S subunit
MGTKKIFQIKSGDLIFSNVFAWEGGIAVVKPEDDNRFGSHRFISCIVDDTIANVDFLCFHFLSSKGLSDIINASPGGAGRNKTLGLTKLMNIQVPIPTLKLQNEFVSMLHKFNQIKNNPNTQLTQLLPSLLHKAFNGELV